MGQRTVKVSDVMQTSVHTVEGLSSVHEALSTMHRHAVSSVVIERRDDDDEFGVITIHDIASKVLAAERSVERTSVYEVMTKPALTLDCEMNIKYAIRLLTRFNQTRALVTRGKDLIGIVTLRDLVLGYAQINES